MLSKLIRVGRGNSTHHSQKIDHVLLVSDVKREELDEAVVIK